MLGDDEPVEAMFNTPKSALSKLKPIFFRTKSTHNDRSVSVFGERDKPDPRGDGVKAVAHRLVKRRSKPRPHRVHIVTQARRFTGQSYNDFPRIRSVTAAPDLPDPLIMKPVEGTAIEL